VANVHDLRGEDDVGAQSSRVRFFLTLTGPFPRRSAAGTNGNRRTNMGAEAFVLVCLALILAIKTER
jgi:hypothetical protein